MALGALNILFNSNCFIFLVYLAYKKISIQMLSKKESVFKYNARLIDSL